MIYRIDEIDNTPHVYFDFWNLRTKKYIGIYEINTGKYKVGLSVDSDSDGYIYLPIIDPYPSVQKFSLIIKE